MRVSKQERPRKPRVRKIRRIGALGVLQNVKLERGILHNVADLPEHLLGKLITAETEVLPLALESNAQNRNAGLVANVYEEDVDVK